MDFFFLTRGKKQAWLAKTKTLNEKQRNGFRFEIFEKSNLAKNNATQEEKESHKRVNIIIVVIFIKGV